MHVYARKRPSPWRILPMLEPGKPAPVGAVLVNFRAGKAWEMNRCEPRERVKVQGVN